MGALRRLLDRLGQSDAERRADEVRRWAASVPGATPIAACPNRARTRVAGVIRRLTIKPGEETLEAVIADGTGELTATWTGRSHIPGLRLGSRVTLEGVVAEERRRRRMVNPVYEFLG
jgi:hypothetical protein